MITLNPTTVPVRTANRFDSVDAVRGLVMVLMALDHVREFLPTAAYNPLDPDRTSLGLFLTRWITHFCAPTFAFLAGLGAGLARERGSSRGELSRFLVSRGLWLILLEITVIWWFGWEFWVNPRFFMLTVIWMLGASMVVLAGLIYLPRAAIAVLALGQILLHNGLDHLRPASLGPGWADLWKVLHVPGMLELPRVLGLNIGVFYPLIPWIGVVAAGYLLARTMTLPPEVRRARLTLLGWGCVAAFIVLRYSNLWGDPIPWAPRGSSMRTVFAFLNCQKYPPSLCYLLMALGPMFLLLALLDGGVPAGLQGLLVFGRVPLFFYLIHIPLIHLMAVVTCLVTGREVAWLFGYLSRTDITQVVPRLGFTLLLDYCLWVVALIILYPLCKRFGEWKRNQRVWWARYL